MFGRVLGIVFRSLFGDPTKVRMFVRASDDSDTPARVGVEMTKQEAKAMFHEMQQEWSFLSDPTL